MTNYVHCMDQKTGTGVACHEDTVWVVVAWAWLESVRTGEEIDLRQLKPDQVERMALSAMKWAEPKPRRPQGIVR